MTWPKASAPPWVSLDAVNPDPRCKGSLWNHGLRGDGGGTHTAPFQGSPPMGAGGLAGRGPGPRPSRNEPNGRRALGDSASVGCPARTLSPSSSKADTCNSGGARAGERCRVTSIFYGKSLSN